MVLIYTQLYLDYFNSPTANTDGIINKLVTVFAGGSSTWITTNSVINPDSLQCQNPNSLTGDNTQLGFDIVPRHCSTAKISASVTRDNTQLAFDFRTATTQCSSLNSLPASKNTRHASLHYGLDR